MKSLNAKRIATVVAGAALLGMGLAFAGAVTFQSVPIITNSGQPVVQVVVGSSAKASDGVAAANIAAAIGNLAYTSMPVTASVNATQAQSVLQVAVSSAQYTLSNQQVWMNVSGSTSVSGSYSFSALIGSILNGAVQNGVQASTKFLQSGNIYAYQDLDSLTISPVSSPYTDAGVQSSMSASSSYNGGGTAFTTYRTGSGTAGYDNIMQVTNAQLPTLLSNSGSHGESETLWITGFPVYNQQSGVSNFQLLDAGGAYQVTFTTPIQFNGNAVSKATWLQEAPAKLNVPITLLGNSWTIINGWGAGALDAGSQNMVAGGQIQLASSLTPLTTVSIGQNITSGPFKVQLQDLGVNSSGKSPAEVAVYYNGALTNTSSIQPPSTTTYNVSGHLLYVSVNQTFAGYYAYEKWAKMQIYSNVFNVTSGKVFNQTTNPGWHATLLWENTSTTTQSNAVALQSIILYNTTPVALSPGSSFSFIQNPSAYKLTFLPDTFSNYDAITATSSTTSSFTYANPAGSSPKWISEPAQELTVTSQIPNAFTFAGQTGSTVVYDLTPYQVTNAASTNNAFQLGLASPAYQANVPYGVDNVILAYSGSGAASTWVSSSNPLVVSISGYTSNTATSATSTTVTFQTANTGYQTTTPFFNITSISINRALPGTLSINVVANSLLTPSLNSVLIGSLQSTGAQNSAVVYTQAGQTNATLTSPSSSTAVTYNPQNGQSSTTFTLAGSWVQSVATSPQQYFTYTMNEISVPTNTNAKDSIAFGIVNSTGGTGVSPLFQLNYSANFGSNTVGSNTTGTHANMTYIPSGSTSSAAINAQAGFRTERGSKVASITPSTVTIDLAKTVDMLNFAIGPSNSIITSTGSKTIGPFGIGQSVTGFTNLTVAKINATPVLSGASTYSITGIGNITATPSVSTATEPVLLNNMTTPLVVLDSAANPASNLILVGSGYVNALSAQLQSAYNVSMVPTTQIMQAYGTNRVLIAGYYANQTTAAANAFIAQLYAQAAR